MITFSFSCLSFFGLGLRFPFFPWLKSTGRMRYSLREHCLLLCKTCLGLETATSQQHRDSVRNRQRKKSVTAVQRLNSKQMETLASHIEHQLRVGKWDYNVPHTTVYEHELKHFRPLNEEHRAAKIAQVAKKHGFRLRFYSEGRSNMKRLKAMRCRSAKFYRRPSEAVAFRMTLAT